jgi:hypothetical protein
MEILVEGMESILGGLCTVVADEAAAPWVPLHPAADVVLNVQPLVAWQVMPTDVLPAEDGQRLPCLPPTAACKSPWGPGMMVRSKQDTKRNLLLFSVKIKHIFLI